jgi:hypothetical protein
VRSVEAWVGGEGGLGFCTVENRGGEVAAMAVQRKVGTGFACCDDGLMRVDLGCRVS